ncbi:hypothetical protein Spb1_13880 [Planctopirus ephydatiae]|uniref:Uncharacterized protein n=2 Tax=Planctopirus ephydatiae TaxID=2528019 RepID=A0A518GLE6_9PLAN|nr:hypothetical protein Spb1_13880 [Planctopirus ephydatiae]
MGMDFVALIRYSRSREVVRAINRLENQTAPLSAEVRSLWREYEFFEFDWGRACWVAPDNGRQVKRPRGPDLSVALRTVDGFFLTFGQGVCCVYHPLRWRFFLTEPRWQAAMLGACESLADLLQSQDVAVMSDFHPSYAAFFDGAGFDVCLSAAVGQDAEVGTIHELYEEPEPHSWDSHGFWRLRSLEPSRSKPSAREHGL